MTTQEMRLVNLRADDRPERSLIEIDHADSPLSGKDRVKWCRSKKGPRVRKRASPHNGDHKRTVEAGLFEDTHSRLQTGSGIKLCQFCLLLC